MDLTQLTATELIGLYRTGQASPVEAMQQVLERVERVDPILNAFILVDADAGLAAARVSEAAVRVDRIGPRIDAARTAQERVLADVAVHELEAQKRRLASYATQAQFALAAIYDGATAGVRQ